MDTEKNSTSIGFRQKATRRFFRYWRRTWKQKGSQLLKIVLWIAFGITILFALLSVYTWAKNIQKNFDDIHTLQQAELSDIHTLQKALADECKSANTLRNYLLLPPRNCNFFEPVAALDEQAETIEEALYFYTTLLKSNLEKESFEQSINEFIATWNEREQQGINNAETNVPIVPAFLQNWSEVSELTEGNAINNENDGAIEPPFLLEITIDAVSDDNLHIDVQHEQKTLLTISFRPLEQKYILQIGESSATFEEVSVFLTELKKELQKQKTSILAESPENTSDEQEMGQIEENTTEEEINTDNEQTEGADSIAELEKLETLLQSEELERYVDSLGFRLERIEEGEDGTLANLISQENNAMLRQLRRDEEGNIVATLPDGSSPTMLLGLRQTINAAQRAAQEAADISEIENISLQRQTNGRENHLLLGHNGGNIDTIILANVDHSKKHITLMSIPRDLFVEPYKINAYYGRYGMRTFIAKIEELIGQRVMYYGLIDFYIFMDGIDMLGGINIYLPRDVVDPTYRTVDDGVEGTMYFEAGSHHLSGVQALRLARSRATSSDFERAKRQHEILKAAQEKARALGISNADTIISIIRVMLKRIETNISPQDAIGQFFALKDYTIRTGNVMSSQNILVSDYRETASGAKQYILLPQNDDWDLIKKYVWREILKD